MDSRRARQLYLQHAHAMAYVDILKPNGQRGIGSAFHIGDGIFVTARHVVEHNEIVEIKISEAIPVSSSEFFRKILQVDVSDEYIEEYDKTLGSISGQPPLFKHFLQPLEIVEGPYFSEDSRFDVAVFRVRQLHKSAAVVKLGFHWDDWVHRGLWHLSDAIILGYPPIPMVGAPMLVAAKAEINTFVIPHHAPAIHFILSAIPRGGFSGGVAIHENGDALGVVTSSFVADDELAEMGFLSVLSIEEIVKCLIANEMYPEIQRQHHESIFKIGKPPKLKE